MKKHIIIDRIYFKKCKLLIQYHVIRNNEIIYQCFDASFLNLIRDLIRKEFPVAPF